MSLKKKMLMKARSGKKGQTALEYALVVGAISLVLMSAWNVVGKDVQAMISGTIKDRVGEHIEKGNATFRR